MPGVRCRCAGAAGESRVRIQGCFSGLGGSLPRHGNQDLGHPSDLPLHCSSAHHTPTRRRRWWREWWATRRRASTGSWWPTTCWRRRCPLRRLRRRGPARSSTSGAPMCQVCCACLLPGPAAEGLFRARGAQGMLEPGPRREVPSQPPPVWRTLLVWAVHLQPNPFAVHSSGPLGLAPRGTGFRNPGGAMLSHASSQQQQQQQPAPPQPHQQQLMFMAAAAQQQAASMLQPAQYPPPLGQQPQQHAASP